MIQYDFCDNIQNIIRADFVLEGIPVIIHLPYKYYPTKAIKHIYLTIDPFGCCKLPAATILF